MNPGPETGLNAWKFGFKARTKYGVYGNDVYKLNFDGAINLAERK